MIQMIPTNWAVCRANLARSFTRIPSQMITVPKQMPGEPRPRFNRSNGTRGYCSGAQSTAAMERGASHHRDHGTPPHGSRKQLSEAQSTVPRRR